MFVRSTSEPFSVAGPPAICSSKRRKLTERHGEFTQHRCPGWTSTVLGCAIVGRTVNRMIWYAAYGSNLLGERFLAYLRGGSVTGSNKVEYGARDASDPTTAVPYMLPRQLAFGYRSSRWRGGGVCFVDSSATSERDAFGRAWMITVEQLEDVWAQENGQYVKGGAGERPDWTLDLDELRANGNVRRKGNYGRVEVLGHLEGHLVATITCDSPPALNSADLSYLRVVGAGLVETWGMDRFDAAQYLASCPGNQGVIDVEELAEALI